MGQKLSTLNFILKRQTAMDDNGQTLVVNERGANVDGDCVKVVNSTNEQTNADDCTQHNHQHFENIYNCSSGQTNNERDTEDDRSVLPARNETTGDGDGDVDVDANRTVKMEAAANDKAKTRPSKKRNKKKKTTWAMRFSCARLKGSSSGSACSEPEIADKDTEAVACVCTGYHRTENQPTKANDEAPSTSSASAPPFDARQCQSRRPSQTTDSQEEDGGESAKTAGNGDGGNANCPTAEPVIDLSRFNPADYPIEDCDERARLERAREIAEGVDAPPGFSPKQVELASQLDVNFNKLTELFQSALSLSALSQIDVPKSVHTQIDYIHCLVPDLLQITSSSFYWGKMDRYEAEDLLENKEEGTFLLRDSAQEEYLFSVSFRKYGRSLHARIEQWNHRFSFDAHDPGVFSSPTVIGLIEHYKDPTCCMFFEPMLTIPLHRNFTFSLQHLCRAVICDQLTYDSITYLKLPKTLKTYMKEYHYKQRVRVRKFDSEI